MTTVALPGILALYIYICTRVLNVASLVDMSGYMIVAMIWTFYYIL